MEFVEQIGKNVVNFKLSDIRSASTQRNKLYYCLVDTVSVCLLVCGKKSVSKKYSHHAYRTLFKLKQMLLFYKHSFFILYNRTKWVLDSYIVLCSYPLLHINYIDIFKRTQIQHKEFFIPFHSISFTDDTLGSQKRWLHSFTWNVQ